jgi:hypothetical protein
MEWRWSCGRVVGTGGEAMSASLVRRLKALEDISALERSTPPELIELIEQQALDRLSPEVLDDCVGALEARKEGREPTERQAAGMNMYELALAQERKGLRSKLRTRQWGPLRR